MSPPRIPKPLVIKELLTGQSDWLTSLLVRSAELSRLQDQLMCELPPPARDHVTVANIDDRTLVLLADSSAWAARLRFQIPQLLSIAREKCNLPFVETVRIRVAKAAPVDKSRSRSLTISRGAADALRRSAEATGDPALRESLLRLSRHR